MVSFSAIITKPVTEVWKHFVFKIDNPQHFVPGVSNVIILEKNDSYIIRKMDITSPDGKTNSVNEKITANPYHVKFLLMDHPVFEGHVDNFAEALNDSETRITFEMHWKNKLTGEEITDSAMIEKAVRKTIEFIEQSK